MAACRCSSISSASVALAARVAACPISRSKPTPNWPTLVVVLDQQDGEPLLRAQKRFDHLPHGAHVCADVEHLRPQRLRVRISGPWHQLKDFDEGPALRQARRCGLCRRRRGWLSQRRGIQRGPFQNEIERECLRQRQRPVERTVSISSPCFTVPDRDRRDHPDDGRSQQHAQGARVVHLPAQQLAARQQPVAQVAMLSPTI